MSTTSSSSLKGHNKKRYVSGHRFTSSSSSSNRRNISGGSSIKSNRSKKSHHSDYPDDDQDYSNNDDDGIDDGRSVATRLLKSRDEKFVDQFIGGLTPVSEDNNTVAPSSVHVPKHIQQRMTHKQKKRQQQQQHQLQQHSSSEQQQHGNDDSSTLYTNTDTRTLDTLGRSIYTAGRSLYTNNRSTYTDGGGRSLYTIQTNRTASNQRRHRGGRGRGGAGSSGGGTFRYLLYGVAIGYVVLYVYEKHQSSIWWSQYNMYNLQSVQQEQQQIATNSEGSASGIYSNLTQGYLSSSSSQQQQQHQQEQMTLLKTERLHEQERRKNKKENQIVSSGSLWQLSRGSNGDKDSSWIAKSTSGYGQQPVQQNATSTSSLSAASSFLWQQQKQKEQQQFEQKDLPKQPRQIFNCEGMDHLIQSFFPDYGKSHKVIRLKWAGMPWDPSHTDEEREQVKLENYKLINETATSDDLFVSNILRGDVCLPDSMTNFPGKSLYHNIEAWDYSAQVPQLPKSEWPMGYTPEKYNYLPPNDQIFLLGPHKTTSQNLQVSYMQLLLPFHGQKQRDKIFDPMKRPTNTKQHFCLYLNSHYVDYREEAAQAVAKLGTIHTNDICEGNPVLGPSKPDVVINCKPFDESERPSNVVHSPYLDLLETNPVDGNEVMFGNYRYGLVLENYYREGYITEKLLNAFLGGTVPIFYGTRQVFEIFNDKAFIYYDIENPQQALDRIAHLEANPKEYDRVLKEPILKDGETTIQQYFSLRDDVGGGMMKNQMLKMMGYRTTDIL